MLIDRFKISLSTLLRCLILVAGTALVPPAIAQSSEQSTVSIIRGESVKISNIDDWLIGVFTSIDTINSIQYQWDWECVYSSTGSYQVNLVSQNGGSELVLRSSAGDEMKYWLYVYFRQGGTYNLQGFTTPVININNMSGSQSLSCADEPIVGSNLWFAALVRPNDFNPAPPGIYQDLMTIIVSPE